MTCVRVYMYTCIYNICIQRLCTVCETPRYEKILSEKRQSVTIGGNKNIADLVVISIRARVCMYVCMLYVSMSCIYDMYVYTLYTHN